MKENFLKTKSYSFALDSIALYKQLVEKKEFILSKQLVRSATSVGANIREANNAQTPADFIHKLSISLKECGESQYWLELLLDSKYVNKKEFDNMYSKSNEIHKMLSSSILTTKQRNNKI